MPMSDRRHSPAGRSQPLVSVITPTVNRPTSLHDAIGSVAKAAEQLHGDVEVIVINDGGPSMSPVVAAWKDELHVKLIELAQHAGAAAARNLGIDVADGTYIAFLDDDDLFLPDHLARGCAPLERDQADFVYLGALVSDRRMDTLPADLSGYPRKAYPYDPRFLHVANFLHTGSVIVRNFRHTPVRFDASLSVCEDWDLWLALITVLGYRVTYVDNVTSIYHQVPEVPGLVSGAQLESPSKFALARTYINAKWPSADPVVVAYREWMGALERYRDDLIAQRRRMPNLLFDAILDYLHGRISHGEWPDHADIGRFFGAAVQSNERIPA